ncbi:hypothetical protein FDI95_gp097 [Citrobacter phage CF1 ERZ-2017]|uniref:Uncharacterized protein n=2 Tax=Moonvirus TaxID=1985329 RepID=A0A0K1LMP0_9CAUD|nr:hypothetical protein CPT_Merlin98 [Citrobacter phage Merlin]YP_009618156.1 hypothetical protein FDI95_gp097 [Citrobacter phage CF1 ERZ-2017]AKU43744.1 hypothetical protein CPT_Merlin98 [Citrobacter phage Merlin]AUE22970.1 hypothetical protein Cf1_00097 [Citrobacter phage CF1 ERZ-2017]
MAHLISYQTKIVLFRNGSFVCDSKSRESLKYMSDATAISYIDLNGSWVQ